MELLGLLGRELLYLSLIAGIAGFVQGLTGFGAVLVGLPLAVLALELQVAVPLLNLLGLGINLWLGYHLYPFCRWRPTLLLVAASLPGIGLGVWLLASVRPPVLEALLGLVLLATPVQPYLVCFRTTAAPVWLTLITGLSAGLLGGSLAANGPPVILYTASQSWPKDEIKATLVMYFLLSGLLIAGWQLGVGLLTARVIAFFAGSLPALLVGTSLGSRLYQRLETESYRRLLRWALALLGLLLLWRTWSRCH